MKTNYNNGQLTDRWSLMEEELVVSFAKQSSKVNGSTVFITHL